MVISIFINDLPQAIQSKVCLFADDSNVYRELNSFKDCELLQKDMYSLEKWEKTWGMNFHPAKCNLMRITNSWQPVIRPYTLKGHQLLLETTSKNLGIEIISNLNWKKNVDRIINKSNSALGFLLCNLRVSSEQTKINAFIKMVHSNLEYCCTTWNPYRKEQIQKVEVVQH